MWPLFVAFGAVAGLAGHLYNGTSLRTLAVMDRLDRWPIEVRAAAIGELVGALGFFVPTLIGGGDEIRQRTLAGGAVLAVLPLAFVLRFGLGAVSYAAPVPGGLFAPILVLGAQLGLFFGAFCSWPSRLRASIRRLSPWSAWRRSSRQSCRLRLPASCWSSR